MIPARAWLNANPPANTQPRMTRSGEVIRTSMCMGIADFTCDDCNAPDWCRCDCGHRGVLGEHLELGEN